jgi:hypothetical protein
MIHLKLRPDKTDEYPPEGQVHLLQAFINISQKPWWQRLISRKKLTLSLETLATEAKSHFYVTISQQYAGYFESQILAQYPKTLVVETKSDPLREIVESKNWQGTYLALSAPYVFPIKTYKETEKTESLANLWSFLTKLPEEVVAVWQMVLTPTNQAYWEKSFRSNFKIPTFNGTETTEITSPYQTLFKDKLDNPLLQAQIRLLVYDSLGSTKNWIQEMAGTMGVFSRAEANSFVTKKVPSYLKKGFGKAVLARKMWFWSPNLVLNLREAASVWHLPDMQAAQIKGIDWGKTFISEAPDDLPVAEMAGSEEEKRQINYFAKTDWRNHEAIFGLRQEDRRKHVYIIGKTGTGKSTLIANMAINDIRNGEGVAVIDPHGDLSPMLLSYIPKRRVNDVVYLDPTIADNQAFTLNLFDNAGALHTDVIASGIVSVLYKLYHNSWGPRLEYILRNTILTLLYSGDSTFSDVTRLLTDDNFRKSILSKLGDKDPVLQTFWAAEFDKMNDKMRVESISPILNKVGQFLSSQRIRHIVGSQHSSFNFQDIMDNRKVLIINLAQGKLGEDTTALLGAMFITKIQLTAMERVNLPEEKRTDFHLYVDEFQNFATISFVKILSEARKYRLNLVLANQYIGQVDEEIQRAIFGNVGSLITFLVGAGDAGLFEKEFGSVFTANDLVALKNYEIILKMSINGLTSNPFVAKTLPLPSVVNDNQQKIIQNSLERYYRKI